jgi:hypothetical protein
LPGFASNRAYKASFTMSFSPLCSAGRVALRILAP